VRIVDTFPFDGELDLLEHRLRESEGLVDQVILVEAAETYRGARKKLLFKENRERFAWAASRIRHVVVRRLGGDDALPRERAAVQRNAILLALRDAASDDVVLLLDVDEIPSRSLLERLRSEGIDRPRRLAMTRHYVFADLLGPRSPCCPTAADPFPTALARQEPGRWDTLPATWHGFSGVAVPRRSLDERTAFDLRFRTPLDDPLPDAGRHFSSVDPSARPQQKLSRMFHAEYDGARETAAAHLERCRRHAVHHRGWWYAERPDGAVPPDVGRLLARCPQLRAPPLPSPLARRLVRSWAWLRLWKPLPGRLVGAVDRHFDRLRPLLAPPLLLLDLGRAGLAAALRATGLRLGAERPPQHL
jgi:beta-1,4-mannosyl-glycoprotein beta-1,4-N-acetylglucosaminyltransferase